MSALSTELAALRAENAMLRDLLETQYRETDKARAESEKADDEALELKTELAKLKALGVIDGIQIAERWKRKYERLARGRR